LIFFADVQVVRFSYQLECTIFKENRQKMLGFEKKIMVF